MSTQIQTKVEQVEQFEDSPLSSVSELLKLHNSIKLISKSQPQHKEIPLPTITQSSSYLLSKLPAEIRFQIWQGLLDGLTLDLVVENGKIRLRRPKKSGNLLSVLLASRQSYNELASFLYSTTSLTLQHPSTLLHLSHTLPPSSLQSITSLSLIWPLIGLPHLSYINLGSYHLHRNEIDALRIWDVISSMKGLKTLKVELNVPGIWRESWRGWEDVLLECLCEVGGGFGREENWAEVGVGTSGGMERERDFGLWVPWPKIEKKEVGDVDGKNWADKLGCQIFWS